MQTQRCMQVKNQWIRARTKTYQISVFHARIHTNVSLLPYRRGRHYTKGPLGLFQCCRHGYRLKEHVRSIKTVSLFCFIVLFSTYERPEGLMACAVRYIVRKAEKKILHM